MTKKCTPQNVTIVNENARMSEEVQVWLKGGLENNKGKGLNLNDAKQEALEEAQSNFWKYKTSLKVAYELEFAFSSILDHHALDDFDWVS